MLRFAQNIMSDNDELADLLACCARREPAALRRLYQLTAPRLFAVAVRILKLSHRAEEALQDGFIRIWEHAAEYRPERGAPMAWLASIVRHRALDLRRRDTAMTTVHPASFDDFADDSPGPAQQVQLAADARALHDCLETLDHKQQHAIRLAFFDGMTHAELAAHLDEQLGTVKSWVRRGLERLKRCLEA